MKDSGPLTFESSGRRRKAGLTTARVISIVLAAGTLLGGLYFARKSGTNPEAYGNDFNVYFKAAREIIAVRDPYRQSLGDWTPYIYPPLFAELMVPLAFLPLPVAAYLWFLISAASMGGAAWVSARLTGYRREHESPSLKGWVHEGGSWRIVIAAVALVVVLRFVLDTLDLGQVNGVVTGLAAAHVYLYARGKKTLSAVALVIAVSIKLTPGLLLVYHLAKLRLRFVLACVVLIIALNALSLVPFGGEGVDTLRTFISRTVENDQGYDFAYSGNQSLRGAIARLAHVDQPLPNSNTESRNPVEGITLGISIVLLLFAVFAAVRARDELTAAAPFFCCMVMLSPLSWKAHYVILILPVTHLVSLIKTPGKFRYASTVVLFLSFALFNLTSPRVIGFALAEWADAHSLVLAGALLIYVATVASGLTKSVAR